MNTAIIEKNSKNSISHNRIDNGRNCVIMSTCMQQINFVLQKSLLIEFYGLSYSFIFSPLKGNF